MSSVLERARQAYGRRDWPLARELYEAARNDGELGADDMYALSDALWWIGDNDGCLDVVERAYRLYIDDGRPGRAAIAATDVAVVHFLRGEENTGSGWMSRAQRLLEGEPESVEHGYLRYILEVEGPLGGIAPSVGAELDSLLSAAKSVQALGRTHRDPTLVTAGLLGEGRALVKAGRVTEGLALLDEAMLSLLSDDLNPVWAGNIYCNLMSAAHEIGDVRRAREWTDATTRWLAGIPVAVVFNGICRVHRSQVHQLSGAWDLALEEAGQVCKDLAGIHSSSAAEANYQVGEIRRLRGDFPGAEDGYQQAHALGRDPQPGLALLRLAQGRIDDAATSIRAGLAAEGNSLLRARLLAAQAEITVASGDLETARAASAELDEIAGAFPSTGLEVSARHVRGSTLLASESPEEALGVLRDACRRWHEIDAPYECGRVRLLLARAYRSMGDEDAARRELGTAASVFRRLGAVGDLRIAESELGGTKLPAGLTQREAQVLALVAAGRSNREIASELVISEKTVARHLSNIFTKLGVTSRTGAAAFAFEHGLAVAGRG